MATSPFGIPGFGSQASSPWNQASYQQYQLQPDGSSASPNPQASQTNGSTGYWNPYTGQVDQNSINMSTYFPSQYGPGNNAPTPQFTYASSANGGQGGWQQLGVNPTVTGSGPLSGVPQQPQQASFPNSGSSVGSNGSDRNIFTQPSANFSQRSDGTYIDNSNGNIYTLDPTTNQFVLTSPGQAQPTGEPTGVQGGPTGVRTQAPGATQQQPSGASSPGASSPYQGIDFNFNGGSGVPGQQSYNAGPIRGFTPLVTGDGTFKTVWPISGDMTTGMGQYLGTQIGNGVTPFNQSIQLPTGQTTSAGQLYAGADPALQQQGNFYSGGPAQNNQQAVLLQAMQNGLIPNTPEVLQAAARGDLTPQTPDAILRGASGNLNAQLPGAIQQAENGQLNPSLPGVLGTAMSGGLTPQNSTVSQIAQTGDPTDQTAAWQSMIQAQQHNIQENEANLREQFGSTGNLKGSSFQTAANDFMSQTTKDQNTLLAQMQTQASEAAAGRKLQAGQDLLGASATGSQIALSAGQTAVQNQQFGTQTQVGAAQTDLNTQVQNAQIQQQAGQVQADLYKTGSGEALSAGQTEAQLAQQGSAQQLQTAQTVNAAYDDLGKVFQGMDQNAINSVLQEFIRTSPEYSPLLQYMYGFSTTFPPTVTDKYGIGASGGITQGIGSALQGLTQTQGDGSK